MIRNFLSFRGILSQMPDIPLLPVTVCLPMPSCSEKAMAPHSSTLAWKIPWTEEPGGLQSMGSLGVGHDWENSLSLFTFMHWKRQWQPTPVFLPGESQWWAWWAAVYGVAQTQTWLRQLSSSSINPMKMNGCRNICTAIRRRMYSHLCISNSPDSLYSPTHVNICLPDVGYCWLSSPNL